MRLQIMIYMSLSSIVRCIGASCSSVCLSLGSYDERNTLNGLEAFSLRLFTDYLGWSTLQVKILLAGAEKGIKCRKDTFILARVTA